jgi:transposase
MQEAKMKCKDIGEKLNMLYLIVSTILKSWKIHGTKDQQKEGLRPQKLLDHDVRELSHSVSRNQCRMLKLQEISIYTLIH